MNQAVALQYIVLLDWDGKYYQGKCNLVRFTHRYVTLVCGCLRYDAVPFPSYLGPDVPKHVVPLEHFVL